MQVPASVKPAIWGAIGGAIAAMIIGFGWGGWVTGGTAGKMVATSAQDASVLALTPLCVAKAEQQPEQLVLLKKESSWNRRDFVIKAGWVANVNEKYPICGRKCVRIGTRGSHGCEACWLIAGHK